MKRTIVSFMVATSLVLAVPACDSGGGGTPIYPLPPTYNIASWSFVDGDAAIGINKVATDTAHAPQLTVFGSKLYAAWEEWRSPSQIRVAVYNGNDIDPAWAFVDGNGRDGINHPTQPSFSPQLTVFGMKLYATWHECEPFLITCQIFVAVYNGDDGTPAWTFVDGGGAGGINKDTAKDARNPQLTVFGSKLYATWHESNGTAYQIRVAVYNGNDSAPAWAFKDGASINGLNKDTTKSAQVSQLKVFGTKLYATWSESNGSADQVRVAVYNGDDGAPAWTFKDGDGINGLNKDAAQGAFNPQLTVFGSKLYATWAEVSGSTDQIRVAVYNGKDTMPAWAFVDGGGASGINKDSAQIAFNPQLTVFGTKLYATWQESNGSADQVRVAVYNGNDSAPAWTFKDGDGINGLNKDTTKSAQVPQLTAFGEKLYAAWQEFNGTADQIRVVVGK